MSTTHRYYCIFCHGRFEKELEPVLGFATARACAPCQDAFRKKTEENVRQIIKEHYAGQVPRACSVCEGFTPDRVCLDCGAEFHLRCADYHECWDNLVAGRA